MPTRIVFTGGETILVAEDLDVVVKALEDISPNAADLVRFTRKAAHADPAPWRAAGQRPAAGGLYVTPT